MSPGYVVVDCRRAWSRLKELGAWGVLDQIAIAGSGFFVAAVVARSGGPDALGLFALVQGFTLLVAGLLKAALGDPLVIEAYGERRLDGLAIALPIVLGHLGLGLLAAIVWLLVGGRLRGLPAPSHNELLLAFLLPLASFQELARSLRLAGVGERGLCLGDVFVALARLATIAIGVGHLTGLKLGLAALSAGGLVSVVTIWRELRFLKGAQHLSRLWQLGRWLVGESLLYGITTYGIWLLIVPRAGPGVAGELRAGQQLFAPIQTILIGLNVVLLSRLARPRDRRGVSGSWFGLLQAGITGAWGALLVVLGPQVAILLFGPTFRLSRSYMAVLTATLMVTAIFEFAALQLRAAGRVRSLIVARATASAMALSGAALIGTSFVGVATSLLIGSLVGARLARAGLVDREVSIQHHKEVTGCERHGCGSA